MTVPSDEQLPAGYRFVRSSASGGIVRVGGDNGVGGSSSVAVYLAVNDVLGRQVAVKAVSVGRLVDPWSAATTVREAQTLAQLNHPNIVRVYELVSRGDLDLIVMEFVGGGTLADLVGRPEPGRNVRLRLLIETAAGLGYLHRAGVVHRDIKPRNVLLSETGVAKIADFGLVTAAVVTDDPLHTEIGGVVAGTPGHWSPEQARGETVGPPSDVFSLATVARQVLAGHLPDAARRRVNRRLDVADVLARCLHPHPAARPRDGDEMYQLLSTAADAENVGWRDARWHRSQVLASQDVGHTEEELETITPNRPIPTTSPTPEAPAPQATRPPAVQRLVVQPPPNSVAALTQPRRMGRRSRRLALILAGAAVGAIVGLFVSSHL